ncbi:MAG: hypothetical protein WC553_02080 [Patescibacteria group bacterium]|jgi:hypothetical protein
MLETARTWLWNNRKVLITTLLVYGLLQCLFYSPQYLIAWVVATLVVLTLGVWWISSFDREWRNWLWLLTEVVWIVAAGVGFVVFNLLSSTAFQVSAIVITAVVLGLLILYESYLQEGNWPIRFFSLLDFIDLLAFFFLTASMLMASDLYSWQLVFLLVAISLEVILAVNLRFWRERIESRRKWLYTIIMLLVLQQVTWITSFWHRGVFLKTFLVAMLFYLFVDFIVHYLKGTLTVRVAVEYIGLVVLTLVAVFLVDWLVVLQ